MKERLQIRNGSATLIDCSYQVLYAKPGIKRWSDCCTPIMFDKFREECGVFAIYGHPEAANLTYLGLYALQHRGQESAGIASSDGREIHCFKSMGHVADIFTPSAYRVPAGRRRDRTHALLHFGRHRRSERAAFLGGVQQGQSRGGAQRQHHQRARTPRRSGA
jgi:hypothetical protein